MFLYPRQSNIKELHRNEQALSLCIFTELILKSWAVQKKVFHRQFLVSSLYRFLNLLIVIGIIGMVKNPIGRFIAAL